MTRRLWRRSRVGAGRYRYNGKERNEELGLDLTPFRSYDASIGRWFKVDPMAEYATQLTPYRFGFNNPVLWSDPLGLFESRKEAGRYRRQEKNGLNWFNSSIRKQKDGTYAIETSDSSTQKNTLGDVMSDAVVGQTEDGADVTTVALAGSKDIMPSSGENSTFFTVELAQFRDGTSLTADRPILIPGGGAAASGGMRLASMGGRMRVSAGQVWAKVKDVLNGVAKSQKGGTFVSKSEMYVVEKITKAGKPPRMYWDAPKPHMWEKPINRTKELIDNIGRALGGNGFNPPPG